MVGIGVELTSVLVEFSFQSRHSIYIIPYKSSISVSIYSDRKSIESISSTVLGAVNIVWADGAFSALTEIEVIKLFHIGCI